MQRGLGFPKPPSVFGGPRNSVNQQPLISTPENEYHGHWVLANGHTHTHSDPVKGMSPRVLRVSDRWKPGIGILEQQCFNFFLGTPILSLPSCPDNTRSGFSLQIDFTRDSKTEVRDLKTLFQFLVLPPNHKEATFLCLQHIWGCKYR